MFVRKDFTEGMILNQILIFKLVKHKFGLLATSLLFSCSNVGVGRGTSNILVIYYNM